jgi:hypothetical protein
MFVEDVDLVGALLPVDDIALEAPGYTRLRLPYAEGFSVVFKV